MKEQGIDLVDLSVGEPDFPTPEHIRNAAIEAIKSNKTRYTMNQGIELLRQAIIRKFEEENNLKPCIARQLLHAVNFVSRICRHIFAGL